jgi:anti-sigma factor RsiW
MKHVTHLIQAYLDGELAAADRAYVAAHLADCEACRRELDDLSRLFAAIDQAQATPTLAPIWPALAVRLAARTDERTDARRRPAWSWSYRGLAAAAAVTGLLLGWQLGAAPPAGADAPAVAVEAGYLETTLPSLDLLWLQLDDLNGEAGS